MSKTKEIIAALQKADPTGEMDVVFNHDDGYAYDIFASAEKASYKDGVEDEDGEANCIKLG